MGRKKRIAEQVFYLKTLSRDTAVDNFYRSSSQNKGRKTIQEILLETSYLGDVQVPLDSTYMYAYSTFHVLAGQISKFWWLEFHLRTSRNLLLA